MNRDVRSAGLLAGIDKTAQLGSDPAGLDSEYIKLAAEARNRLYRQALKST